MNMALFYLTCVNVFFIALLQVERSYFNYDAGRSGKDRINQSLI